MAEGFPRGSVIFLDQEEGGRMLPEQKQYVFAWADAVGAPDSVPESIARASRSPSRMEAASAPRATCMIPPQGRELVFWVANDACPPSPGCSFPHNAAAAGGQWSALRRGLAVRPIARASASSPPPAPQSYNPDGNCYPPDSSRRPELHLDLNSARLPDPSHARQCAPERRVLS